MFLSATSSPAKLPSLIIARWGQVWLPIGSPSGLAFSRATPPASMPATIASVPAILTNSRRVIAVIFPPAGILSRLQRSCSRARLHSGQCPAELKFGHCSLLLEGRAKAPREVRAMTTINRRTFLGGLGAASALTIVPRRVLGGPGYVPPSDMILLAQVGCGTQAQRQVNTGLVTRPDLQFVAVVDPNRDSQDYVDWGPWGNRDDIREFLGEPDLGRRRHGHPRRPRRGACRSWRRTTRSRIVRAAGSGPTKTSARCSRRRRTSRASSTSRPTTSTARINISALRKGKAAISHKPVASVLYEVRRVLAGRPRELGAVASAGLQQQSRSAHARGMDRGRRRSGTCARCTTGRNRPFWPQGMQEYHASGPPVPRRLQLDAVAGARARSSLPSRYTFAVYRGWYAYGTGCLGDMGHYSLWQPYRILAARRSRIRRSAAEQRRVRRRRTT